ncbi:MAG TPA: flippase [Campylobacterales bacterium]|nr:flippase [Campylobacterales bacterium]
MDNFLSLTALQGINTLVPLLAFPYLVRVLGIEQFGLFSFVMAIMLYAEIITDYGFDLSATKHISTSVDNQKKIDEIFSSVIMIKSVMALLFFLFLLFLITFVDKFSENASLYVYAYGLIVGQVLFPVWFFQGIEKMRYITILNAVSKIIFAVAIFIFVNVEEDLYLVFLFYSLGSMVAGALAFNIAVKKFGVSFSLQSKETYLYYLKDAWYIFTSRVAVQLYQSINVIVLAFFVSNTVVGYYAIVEKIVRAGGSIIVSLPKAVYPHLAKVYKRSVSEFYMRNMQLSLALFMVMAPIAGLVYYFAPEILSIFTGGEPSEEIVTLLHILAPLLAITVFGSQFTNVLVILNETKLLNNIVVIAGLVNAALVFGVIHYFSVEGLAWLNIFIIGFVIIATKAYYIFFKFRKRDLRLGKD